ncbi:MAG: phosphate acyltransferase PlsX [Anaeromicrobium sp.]|jgi:glycerol-3-phosphate acyltransferase PlsX|uniref:phosphate acyltransferase PlsX n=1 Tax=Anaeromicrobium sp. TaxID=1929132 RepID=UPI0025D5FDC4|nr:phosphate acyltransferase PlsX [Anaeromicrobium sp.]MCT4594878.1 phosphate acyltransferase PlsX [Anaeromicrobium sp.]
MRIAIDAMGGDNAPHEIVKGCVEALEDSGFKIDLIGKSEILKKELEKYTFDENRINVINADEVIENTDKPVRAIKRKKNASMVVGFDMLNDNKVDAFISAGNTGAILAGSLLKVGRIEGVDRPAITTVYPTKKGVSLLVDAGANSECKPRNLLEFSIMASAYSKYVLGNDNPSVGLVNIGEESSKGTSMIKETYEVLKDSHINFYGNVEGRELPEGVVDIIVCDGFVGNVILKLTEGVAKTITDTLKNELSSSIFSKVGSLFLLPALKSFKKRLDYTEYGGAPFLGVKKPVIKAHGSSNAKAIKNAVKKAKVFAQSGVIDTIGKEIKRIGVERDGK